MCHPLMITKSKVDIEAIPATGTGARDDGRVGFRVTATAGCDRRDGIEMEALTAASVACLTIYDMCRAVDRGMEIVDVRLLRKEGGRSGVWERGAEEAADVAAEPEPSRPSLPPPFPEGPGSGAPRRHRVHRLPEFRPRPRWWRRSSPASPSADCAWAPSSTTDTRALISTSWAKTPGAMRRRAAGTWGLIAPNKLPNMPTRARRRSASRICSRATPTSTS